MGICKTYFSLEEEKLITEIFGRGATKKELEKELYEWETRCNEEKEYYSSFIY